MPRRADRGLSAGAPLDAAQPRRRGRLPPVLRHARAAQERRRPARRLRAAGSRPSEADRRGRTRCPSWCSPGQATAEAPAAGSSASRGRRSPGRVRHLGYVDPHAAARSTKGARLLVQPSFEEGFGLPVLEAMTLGVPVVAANRGALPEVLGDAGLLVDPDDPDEIAAAIARLLDDDGFARGVRGEGRRCVARLRLGAHRRTASTTAYQRAHPNTANAHRDRRARAVRPRHRRRPLSRRAADAVGRRRRPRRHEFVLYAPERARRSALDARRVATRLVAGGAGHLVGAGAAAARGGRDHLDVFFAPATPRRFGCACRRSSRSTTCRSPPTRNGSGARRAPAPLADPAVGAPAPARWSRSPSSRGAS